MSSISAALLSLRPGSAWEIKDPLDYYSLIWKDENTVAPTLEEIQIEQARLDVQFINDAYKEKRAKEYPAIGDQLDALWKGGAAAETMLAQVMAVKAKYPKTEGA